MRHWLRWRFVVPRLLLCLLAVIGAHAAAGLAARKLAMRYGAQLFGVRVDVAKARVAYSNGHLLLGQLSVADPCDAGKRWFTAEQCEVAVAAAPLLAKQVIVPKARMGGVRFDDLANPSGNATGESGSTSRWFKDHAVEAARDQLAKISDRFDEKYVDCLESVRRTGALSARWPSAITAMSQRAEALEACAAELENAAVVASGNPLRNRKMFDDLSAKVGQMSKELECLSQDFEQLPRQLEEERRAIVAARRQDEELVRGRLHVEPVDAKLLNAYLLREEASQRLDCLLGWLERLREMAPEDAGRTHVAKRGEDVVFAGLRPRPDVLIQALEFEGEVRIAGRPVGFRGLASNLTTTPTIYGEPVQLQLSAKDSLPFEVRATIDRTRGRMRDELFVEFRELPIGERSLGQTGQLRLQAAPSIGSLTVTMCVDGDKLSGDIRLIQQQVRMTPEFVGHGDTLPLGELLDQSLGKLGSVATRISLGGTVDEPACTLWSNLAPAVAEALEHGLQRHAEERAEVVLGGARRQVDERLAELDRQMADARERFASRVANMSQRIEAIAQAQAPRERMSVEQAGRRLPTTSILR